MREVLQIPKPSQLDDWAWYEKLEKEAIKQRGGAVRLSDWQTARGKEKAEQDYWRKVRDFKREMRRDSETGGSSDTPSPRQTQWPRRNQKLGNGTGVSAPEVVNEEEEGGD